MTVSDLHNQLTYITPVTDMPFIYTREYYI